MAKTDFNVLLKKAGKKVSGVDTILDESDVTYEPEVLDDSPFNGEIKTADPFDLERLKATLDPFNKKGGEMVTIIESHLVVDDESRDLMVTYGTQLSGIKKKFNAEVKKINAPYWRIYSGINKAKKGFNDTIDPGIEIAKTKISKYSREQAEQNRRIAEKKAAEERKRLQAEAEKERLADLARQEKEREAALKLQEDLNKQAAEADVEPVKVEIPDVVDPGTAPIVEKAVPDTKGPVRTESGTGSIIEKWTFELVDIAQVPEKYTDRIVNKKKAQEDIDAGVREIPGLRVYQKDSVRFRAKS